MAASRQIRLRSVSFTAPSLPNWKETRSRLHSERDVVGFGPTTARRDRTRHSISRPLHVRLGSNGEKGAVVVGVRVEREVIFARRQTPHFDVPRLLHHILPFGLRALDVEVLFVVADVVECVHDLDGADFYAETVVGPVVHVFGQGAEEGDFEC